MQFLSANRGPLDVQPLPIPGDCIDGFLGAYWQRPEAYLDPEVRAVISSFSHLGNSTANLKRLERDLASGAWDRRNAHLLACSELDVGYRLVVAQRRSAQL